MGALRGDQVLDWEDGRKMPVSMLVWKLNEKLEEECKNMLTSDCMRKGCRSSSGIIAAHSPGVPQANKPWDSLH